MLLACFHTYENVLNITFFFLLGFLKDADSAVV